MTPFISRLIGLGPVDVRRISGASLQLRNGGELGWIVFIALVATAFTWWIYTRQEAHRALAEPRRRVLMCLRLALLLLILGILLRPVVALVLDQEIRRTLLLLVDDTRSMNIPDKRIDPADRMRPQAVGLVEADPARARIVTEALRNPRLRLLDSLRKEADVEPYLFDGGLRAAPADWLDHYKPAGNATALGGAITDLLARKRGQPLAGILLITDGAANTGVPMSDAAAAAERDGVPVFTWGVGVTAPRDVIVSHLSAPALAFANDEVAVSAQVRGQGLVGGTGRLSLMLGGTTVASRDIIFTGTDQLVAMTFTPRGKGDFGLVASIPPRPGETSVENNAVRQRIHVIDEKIKVLCIEQSPRWEFRFMQQALLRDRRIDASFVLLDADPGVASGPPYLARFPGKKEDLFKYDLLIIGNVDPRAFGPGQLDMVAEFVSKFGGACICIAGRSSMPEAYRGTALEKMLPVELPPAGAEADATRPVHLLLTPLGRASQLLRLAPDENENAALWAKFPPVYWIYPSPRAKPAAQVLIGGGDPPRPVLATQQFGVGQVFFLATDDLWRLRRDEGGEQYPVLWGQLAQGAALAHLLGASRKTQLSIDREEHDIGDAVTVYARLYNDAYQPVAAPQVAAQYDLEGAKTPLALRPVPDQPGMYRGDFVATRGGRYTISTMSDPAATAQFTAREPQFELGDTAMNEAGLRDLAGRTGGKFLREEELASLPSLLAGKPVPLRTTRDVEFWSSPLYFLLIVGIATAEWLLRKRAHLK